MEQRKENIFCYRDDTEEIRTGDWKANVIPENLRKRHVELTGPGNDPKMVINAMNSSAVRHPVLALGVLIATKLTFTS